MIVALMLGRLYGALIAGGTPEDEARAAAEEVASYERDIAGVRQVLTKIEGEVNLLRWMMGANFAVTVAILIKLFVH
jgi:hypothetical protein